MLSVECCWWQGPWASPTTWGAATLTAHVDSTLVPRLPHMDIAPEQQRHFLEIAQAMVRLSASDVRACGYTSA